MKRFRSLSLSSQIFFLITSFILLLIAIQYLVYQFVFSGYYMNTQLATMQEQVDEYLIELKSDNVDNYFQTIYQFTADSNTISVILDSNLNPVETGATNYSVEVTDTTNYETYSIILPETNATIKLSDRITAQIKPSVNIEGQYDIYGLTLNNQAQYDLECAECITIKGIATKINTPSNMNFYYATNQIAISELFLLKANENYDLENYIEDLETSGKRFIHESSFSRNVTFLHKVNDEHYALTIFVMESTENMSNILGTYNFSIYAVMVTLAIIISMIASNLITKPISDIDSAAKEIANLNFEVNVQALNNKETSSLSNSINQIAINLKENIKKLNDRNKEVIRLYENQVSQVELRKKFISAISHELKTPLMVINITTQGIIDGIFSEDESQDELEKILAEIVNLDSMIKDLLDVYRLDELDVKEDLERINLKRMTESVLINVENLLTTYNHKVTVNTSRDSYIYANSKFLQMVISNLITNAIKYTPNNERIVIEINSVRDKIVYKVKNYGVTIPQDDLDHIWEPFYRVDESRTKTTKSKGSGLGLYIVKETLKAHGFSYEIKNIENGVQASFTAPKYQK